MADCLIFTDATTNMTFARTAGPYRIATALRDKGYQTQVVEFFASLSLREIEQVFDRYLDKNTLFVGFSTTFFRANKNKVKYCYSTNNKERFTEDFPQEQEFIDEVFRLARKKSPNIKFVMGGGKAIFQGAPQIDFWVTGFADSAVVALADHLSGRSLNSLKASTVEGGGQLIESNSSYVFEEFPSARIDYHESDHIMHQESLPIETARGCAFRCAFCHFPFNGKGKNDHLKSPEVLREEMVSNYERFGTQRYILADDLFNDSLAKVESFHKMFTSLPFELEWTSFLRVDIFYGKPAMRELLLEMGLTSCFIGIETLNQAVGRKVGKGLAPEKTIELLHWLRELWGNKVKIESGFIVGLPGEERASIEKTFDWIMEKDNPLDSWTFYPLTIRSPKDSRRLFYSPIDAQPEKYGYNFASDADDSWYNDHFTYGEAADLAESIMKQSFNKRKIAGFQYPRFRNLGFDQSTIDDMTWEKAVERLDEIVMKKEEFRSQYMTQVIGERSGIRRRSFRELFQLFSGDE